MSARCSEDSLCADSRIARAWRKFSNAAAALPFFSKTFPNVRYVFEKLTRPCEYAEFLASDSFEIEIDSWKSFVAEVASPIRPYVSPRLAMRSAKSKLTWTLFGSAAE